MNIDFVKEDIKKNIGRMVEAKCYGMRNKTDIVQGRITGVYPKLFIISNNRENKSINYVDIITKEVTIKYL